jgi:hypothetical protein
MYILLHTMYAYRRELNSIYMYNVCTCICNVHTCFNQLSQQQILVCILGVYPCMYKMVDMPMSKAAQESMQWQIQ